MHLMFFATICAFNPNSNDETERKAERAIVLFHVMVKNNNLFRILFDARNEYSTDTN